MIEHNQDPLNQLCRTLLLKANQRPTESSLYAMELMQWKLQDGQDELGLGGYWLEALQVRLTDMEYELDHNLISKEQAMRDFLIAEGGTFEEDLEETAQALLMEEEQTPEMLALRLIDRMHMVLDERGETPE